MLSRLKKQKKVSYNLISESDDFSLKEISLCWEKGITYEISKDYEGFKNALKQLFENKNILKSLFFVKNDIRFFPICPVEPKMAIFFWFTLFYKLCNILDYLIQILFLCNKKKLFVIINKFIKTFDYIV